MSGTRKQFEDQLVKLTGMATFKDACSELEFVRFEKYVDGKCLCGRVLKHVIVIDYNGHEFEIGKECGKHFNNTNRTLYDTIDKIRQCKGCDVMFEKIINGHNLCEDCMFLKVGKYKDKTHQYVLKNDPYYCKYVLGLDVEKGDKMYNFYLFCQKYKNKILEDRIPVGKFKGETFSNVLTNQPNYCEWVLSTKPDHKSPLYKFYIYLSKMA